MSLLQQRELRCDTPNLLSTQIQECVGNLPQLGEFDTAGVVACGVKSKWMKPFHIHLLDLVHFALSLSRAAVDIHSLKLTNTTWYFSTFNVTDEADFPVHGSVPVAGLTDPSTEEPQVTLKDFRLWPKT